VVFKELVVDESFISEMSVFRGKPSGFSGLVASSSVSPVFFSERMLGVVPYSWQVYVLELFRRLVVGRARRVSLDLSGLDDCFDGSFRLLVDGEELVVITSRQIGKSTLLALLSVWLCVFNRVPGTLFFNTSVLIVSASDDQSKKLLREINRLLLLGDAHMSSYLGDDGEPLFGREYFSSLLSDSDPNNTSTITFSKYDVGVHGDYLLKGSLQGSTIKSYPPTSKVLGETASVLFVDEAGKTDKISDLFLYDYLYPVGNSTSAIRAYTSTPWTTSGFFYRAVDPDGVYGESNFLVVCFTIDAIRLENPGYYESVMKTIKSMESDGKLDEVQRAYYCRFVKGEKSYFKPGSVDVVFDKDLVMLEGSGLPVDLGVDFGGQVSSRTVVTISHFNEDSGVVSRLYHRVYPVQEDMSLLDDIAELMTRFNVQRVVVDDCPAGDYLIRVMEQERLWDVTRMNFRTDKVKKYGAFRSLMNKGLLVSYPDSDLKTEMMALEVSSGGQRSLLRAAPGYNDDMIDSWVISCYHFLDTLVDGVSFYDW
jgi:hypothetical protein